MNMSGLNVIMSLDFFTICYKILSYILCYENLFLCGSTSQQNMGSNILLLHLVIQNSKSIFLID